MKKQKDLLLARNLFALIVFTLLGIIIVVEKSKGLLIPKATKDIEKYLNKHYQEISDTVIQEATIYKENTYTAKITSKKNKNLYFYIHKKRKKISDTYQTDFLEGKTLFTYLEKKIKKQIKEKTQTNVTVYMISTLDQYVSTTQEDILQENNLLQLKCYTIKKEIIIKNWTAQEITNEIIDIMKLYNSQDILPKNYTIIITNKNHIKEAIEIKNLTIDFINNPTNMDIINDILEEKESKLLKENKITYKYLEEE